MVACAQREACAVRCLASRMNGEPHPTKNRFFKTGLHMDDNSNELMYFLVLPLLETATGVLCSRLVGALPQTLRYTIITE